MGSGFELWGLGVAVFRGLGFRDLGFRGSGFRVAAFKAAYENPSEHDPWHLFHKRQPEFPVRIWVPLKGLYRDYIGIMEKKMETTI